MFGMLGIVISQQTFKPTGLVSIYYCVQEHGQELNADHALQELNEYVKRYQDQVGSIETANRVL